jgi:predicted SprT family Zn-dependent metalloprotease
MEQELHYYSSLTLILVCVIIFTLQSVNAQTDKARKDNDLNTYVCDICGNTFSRVQLDDHFAETAKQAAAIKGVTWSGRLVTFDTSGKAWCPNCFKDARSMRGGTRTVHLGEKKSYLQAPSVEIDYKCKCGRNKTFNSQSVNIYTGAEVTCADCGTILCVSPLIFDHSKSSKPGIASLRSDYRDRMMFVKYSKSELVQQLKQGIITEQEFKAELKRRGL